MKDKTFAVIAAFTFSLCLVLGCSNDNATGPTPPNDLQYVGNWSGTTSQNKPINITIQNINGRVQITSITITVHMVGNVWSADEKRTLNSTPGLAEVRNGKFSFSISNFFELDGTFSSESSLSGNFRATADPPFNCSTCGPATASGTYTASKS